MTTDNTQQKRPPKLDVQAVLTLWNESGWTLDEIAAHLGRPRTTVHGAIRRAQAKGLARRGTYPKPVEAPPLAALWSVNRERE
jgi:predicted transcriptional regulator